MSHELHEFARQFVRGEISAVDFADEYIKRWKEERDSEVLCNDSDELSELLSTIFCLADLYTPHADRKEYELDETQLREKVREMTADSH